MISLQEVKNNRYMNYDMCAEVIEEAVMKAADRDENEVYVYLTCTKTVLRNVIDDLDHNGFEIISGLKRMDGEYTIRYIRIRWWVCNSLRYLVKGKKVVLKGAIFFSFKLYFEYILYMW